MSTTIAIISFLLATLLTVSAIMKLSHRHAVVDRYARVGVREDQLNLLAAILLLGALGLLAGLAWPPIGIAAAAGLVAYFALAIAAHIRAGDVSNLLVPVVLEILSGTVLGLGIAARR